MGCATGDAGLKKTFDSVLNVKYFIQAEQNMPRPRSFPSFSCGSLEISCDPWRNIWLILKTTAPHNEITFPVIRIFRLQPLGMREAVWTEEQQRFGGTCCQHLQRMLLDTPEDDSSRSLPTTGLYKTTWNNITNDCNLHELR